MIWVDRKWLLREIGAAVAEVESALPPHNVRFILEEADHAEYAIAFETLCTQLYEFDTPIGSELYRRLAQIGRGLELPPRTWTILEELLVESSGSE